MTAYSLPSRNVATRTALGIGALVALLVTIVTVPALAQEPTKLPAGSPQDAPTRTVDLPPQLVTGKAFRCLSRPLEQGSGNVRVCESGRAL
jgi:hypothetical protein